MLPPLNHPPGISLSVAILLCHSSFSLTLAVSRGKGGRMGRCFFSLVAGLTECLVFFKIGVPLKLIP